MYCNNHVLELIYTCGQEKTKSEGNKKMENKLLEIAKIAGIETLETRNSDSFDFHEISIWTLKEMLEKAYEMGKNSKSRK